MNEIIIDQIPNLTELLKTLEQMSIMNTNAQVSRNPFVVQQIPELRRSIAEGRNWEEIAQYQLANFFTKEAEASEFDEMVKFAEMYSNTNIEALSDGFKCANCLKTATQRCSRCKAVWYCGRECQVEHYKKEHKLHCKALAEKQAQKLDRSGGKEGGLIMKPSEVKNQTAKNTEIPQKKTAEEKPKSRIQVEVLNSTEIDETKPSELQVKTKEIKVPDLANTERPAETTVLTKEQPAEPENKMDELD